MDFLFYLANFAAGLFVCNSLPHLCAGLRGESFPTPFAKPPGAGKSTAAVNVVWGTLNLAIGCYLLHFSPIVLSLNLDAILFLIGFLGIGVLLANHFAKVGATK